VAAAYSNSCQVAHVATARVGEPVEPRHTQKRTKIDKIVVGSVCASTRRATFDCKSTTLESWLPVRQAV
jgi:hypothetical protein